MHPLLKRQVRKFLPEEIADMPQIQAFLKAVGRSYQNNDDKLEMIQRSTTISSKELSYVNSQLRKKIENQKKIFVTLSKVVSVMDNSEDNGVANQDHQDVDPVKLATVIEEQTNKILQLTEERKNLLKDLEEQNESLNNYAHMVSHDLKSPIRNMHTLMSWIIEKEHNKFSDESKFNCDLVNQNLVKVDNLIEGILRHATLEDYEEEKTNISLVDLIDEIKNTIYIPDNIKIIIDGELPVLHKDKYKLEHLFKNLLTNSITATEDVENGQISVKAADKDDYWEFKVRDNGKGIAKKYQDNIFDMFTKLENNAKATGIGLALVKKIVNIYEGHICLESELDKGTEVSFTIKKEVV